MKWLKTLEKRKSWDQSCPLDLCLQRTSPLYHMWKMSHQRTCPTRLFVLNSIFCNKNWLSHFASTCHIYKSKKFTEKISVGPEIMLLQVWVEVINQQFFLQFFVCIWLNSLQLNKIIYDSPNKLQFYNISSNQKWFLLNWVNFKNWNRISNYRYLIGFAPL